METTLEKVESEKALLERELQELMEFTIKMEYELELVLREVQSK